MSALKNKEQVREPFRITEAIYIYVVFFLSSGDKVPCWVIYFLTIQQNPLPYTPLWKLRVKKELDNRWF